MKNYWRHNLTTCGLLLCLLLSNDYFVRDAGSNDFVSLLVAASLGCSLLAFSELTRRYYTMLDPK